MTRYDCISALFAYCFKRKSWEEISQAVNASDMGEGWYIWPSGMLLFKKDNDNNSTMIIRRPCKGPVDKEELQINKVMAVFNIMMGMITTGDSRLGGLKGVNDPFKDGLHYDAADIQTVLVLTRSTFIHKPTLEGLLMEKLGARDKFLGKNLNQLLREGVFDNIDDRFDLD